MRMLLSHQTAWSALLFKFLTGKPAARSKLQPRPQMVKKAPVPGEKCPEPGCYYLFLNDKVDVRRHYGLVHPTKKPGIVVRERKQITLRDCDVQALRSSSRFCATGRRDFANSAKKLIWTIVNSILSKRACVMSVAISADILQKYVCKLRFCAIFNKQVLSRPLVDFDLRSWWSKLVLMRT